MVSTVTSAWFKKLLANAEAVTITKNIVACRDPTVAVNGKADFIVSGDADLLTLNPFQGIRIISPATFVQGASR